MPATRAASSSASRRGSRRRSRRRPRRRRRIRASSSGPIRFATPPTTWIGTSGSPVSVRSKARFPLDDEDQTAERALEAATIVFRDYCGGADWSAAPGDAARSRRARVTTTPATAAPALALVPSQEEQLLRETVSAICRDFGPEYSRRKVERRRAADRAVGRAREPRLPRREPARGVRRRRPRHVGAGGGRRGDLGRRLLAAADRRVARDRRQHPDAARRPRSRRNAGCRGIAAGTTKVAFAITEPDAGSNSHNISTAARRVERQLRPARHEDVHLGRRGLGRDPGRRARTRRRRQPRRCRCC